MFLTGSLATDTTSAFQSLPMLAKNIHREKILPRGECNLKYILMVHEPIPPKQIRLMPEAAKAVQAEWDKLRDLGAWDLATVQAMSTVKADYQKRGKVVHFGRVFPLCFKKHAEKDPSEWKYKGRCVPQGNNVHIESNVHAVFTDQSSSACHHTIGKWMDAPSQ